MIDGLNDEAFTELSKRLAFLKKKLKKVLGERNQAKVALNKFRERKALKNSSIYDILNPLSVEALLYVMAKCPHKSLKKAISHYITHLRFSQVVLTGEDLKKMGLPPGKVYNQVLRNLLRARLDGELNSREDEVAYVQKNFLFAPRATGRL